MKIIGLCGGSGSGKGLVASVFAEFGVPSVDTDIVYKEITSYSSDCMRALVEAFGSEVQNPDGSLNREAMRQKVFSDDGGVQREILNKITHKFILDEAEKRIMEYFKSGKKMVIAEVPLIYESGFDKKCDIVIAVVADADLRIKRITARDGITREQAKARISTQLRDDELRRRADIVIENNGDLTALKEKAAHVYSLLIK